MASDIVSRRQLWDVYQEELVYWCLTRIGFPLSISGLFSICFIFEAGHPDIVLTFIVLMPLYWALRALFDIVRDIVQLDVITVIAESVQKQKVRLRGWQYIHYLHWSDHRLEIERNQWNPIVENATYKILYLRHSEMVLKVEPYQS